jgi:hypothetical protein
VNGPSRPATARQPEGRARLAALALALLLSAPAAARVLEATVARVGDRIIFLSDVRHEWRIDQVLGGRLARASQEDIPEGELDQVLRWRVRQSLVVVYLDRLGLWREGGAQQMEALERGFVGRFPDAAAFEAFLRKAGLDRARLLNLLWERQRVQRFTQEKLHASAKAGATDPLEAWLEEERKKTVVEMLPWKESDLPKE